MSKNLPETSPSEEIDLGQLFKLIGNAFERFFNFIGRLLNKLFLAFVWVVFFVKKNLFKILLGGVLGFAIAFTQQKLADPVYGSTITLQQNYDTGENLYDLIEYYNSLIIRNDSIVLKNVFGLNKQQTKNLVGFEVEPVVSENSRISNYDSYIKTLDSTIASSIDYEVYLENTHEHEYKIQKVTALTDKAIDLSQVFERIVENINSTEYFKRYQEKDLNQLINREAAIKQSLTESEALQKTYVKVLEAVEEKEKGSQTSVTIEGGNNIKQTKEYELFQNDLTLRRELVEIEREKQNRSNITEIVSSELESGVISGDVEIFNYTLSRKIFYAFVFAFLTFLVLFGIEFLKFLEKYKNKV